MGFPCSEGANDRLSTKVAILSDYLKSYYEDMGRKDNRKNKFNTDT